MLYENSKLQRAYKTLAEAQRIVIKIGSAVLNGNECLNLDMVNSIAYQISEQVKNGREILLVSSGAINTGKGMGELKVPPSFKGLTDEEKELSKKQAYASSGQGRLYGEYERAFLDNGIRAGQILLTHYDLEDKHQTDLNNPQKEKIPIINCKHTLEMLLYNGRVPIINENDTVSTREITFGDNDLLGGKIAALMNAEVYISLTIKGGVLDENGNVIPHFSHPQNPLDSKDPFDVRKYLFEDGEESNGGMESKIITAENNAKDEIITVIGPGLDKFIITKLLKGNKERKGTFFTPKNF